MYPAVPRPVTVLVRLVPVITFVAAVMAWYVPTVVDRSCDVDTYPKVPRPVTVEAKE
jgi:hypothetical protein